MTDKCTHCPIRLNCDLFSQMCRLADNEVIRVRPDLVRPMDKRQRYYYKNRDKYRAWNAANARKYRARLREAA